jgi:hypothetical protein
MLLSKQRVLTFKRRQLLNPAALPCLWRHRNTRPKTTLTDFLAPSRQHKWVDVQGICYILYLNTL